MDKMTFLLENWYLFVAGAAAGRFKILPITTPITTATAIAATNKYQFSNIKVILSIPVHPFFSRFCPSFVFFQFLITNGIVSVEYLHQTTDSQFCTKA